jgi:hypothetical protein
MFLARWNSARLRTAWVNGRLARMQRCDPSGNENIVRSTDPRGLTGAGFGGNSCVPSPVLGIRKPKIPLLPLWEKGG